MWIELCHDPFIYANRSFHCSWQVQPQAPQAQNRWCMWQLVYIENCMGKSPIVKKCVNNYLIWNKVFLPQLCRKLISCADFKAILTPFSGVIWNRYSSFLKDWKADHSIHRWSEVTSQIAFSSKGKVPNRDKTNSSMKPNKFHSKPPVLRQQRWMEWSAFPFFEKEE